MDWEAGTMRYAIAIGIVAGIVTAFLVSWMAR